MKALVSLILVILTTPSFGAYMEGTHHIECELHSKKMNYFGIRVNQDFKFIEWDEDEEGQLIISDEKEALERKAYIYIRGKRKKVREYIEFISLDRIGAMASYFHQVDKGDLHKISINLEETEAKLNRALGLKMKYNATITNMNTNQQYKTMCSIQGPEIEI